VDGDGKEPYDNETNAQIEQAYKEKKPAVIVLLAGESDDKPTRYRIDFSTNIETALDTGDTTRVERKETTTGTITIQSFTDVWCRFWLPSIKLLAARRSRPIEV
jgi:hypothetical protein